MTMMCRYGAMSALGIHRLSIYLGMFHPEKRFLFGFNTRWTSIFLVCRFSVLFYCISVAVDMEYFQNKTIWYANQFIFPFLPPYTMILISSEKMDDELMQFPVNCFDTSAAPNNCRLEGVLFIELEIWSSFPKKCTHDKLSLLECVRVCGLLQIHSSTRVFTHW